MKVSWMDSVIKYTEEFLQVTFRNTLDRLKALRAKMPKQK